MSFTKKLLFIFTSLLFIPIASFAERSEEEGFILYRRPLLPGFSLNQTDSTTELIYRGNTIKTYKNEEFAIELLPHGPKEEPDCYNSLSKNIASNRLKTVIWKDYLKSCFVMKSDKIMNDFLLLYSPSIEGNRVSLYDIKKKKFYHWILNTVLSYRRHKSGAIVFLSKNSQHLCNRNLLFLKDGKLTKITDSCFLNSNGIPVKIHSFKIDGDSVEITYSDVNLVGNDYITSKVQRKFSIDLPLEQKKPSNYSASQTGMSLLLNQVWIQK